MIIPCHAESDTDGVIIERDLSGHDGSEDLLYVSAFTGWVRDQLDPGTPHFKDIRFLTAYVTPQQIIDAIHEAGFEIPIPTALKEQS